MRRLLVFVAAFCAPAAVWSPAAAVQPRCVVKAGEATGITRAFAEYEALLIIRQTTGNWPIEKDRISEAVYTCRQGVVLWTCAARAEVCKQ